ncbi:PREDICTED: uncharacterized protein LOC109153574 [Ipomoea nil]|uniref:uncharacterized protein LOC109153574 n=1 Tax=Ipomoea nil TaxID=35883 RepID=UPI000900B6BE|nr:PREDICTED: uncharacterized protein LOC109153574 [Ipomoea nil]
MAKLSRSNGKKKNGMNLKTMVQMFQKKCFLADHQRSSPNHFDKFENSKDVANDVKEGHFTVMAVDNDDKVKRFIVPLSCLRNPCFLRLLEKAAEEYGFQHEGALMLPCRPSELDRILANQYNGRSENDSVDITRGDNRRPFSPSAAEDCHYVRAYLGESQTFRIDVSSDVDDDCTPMRDWLFSDSIDEDLMPRRPAQVHTEVRAYSGEFETFPIEVSSGEDEDSSAVRDWLFSDSND